MTDKLEELEKKMEEADAALDNIYAMDSYYNDAIDTAREALANAYTARDSYKALYKSTHKAAFSAYEAAYNAFEAESNYEKTIELKIIKTMTNKLEQLKKKMEEAEVACDACNAALDAAFSADFACNAAAYAAHNAAHNAAALDVAAARS